MIGFTQFISRRTLGHIAFVGASIVAVALAVPAAAHQGATSASPSAGLSSSADGGGASAPAPRRNRAGAGERRICVDAAYTGTRIPRRICKTESQWEAAGGLEQLTDR
ncbi:MAG: hypothetical protein KF780_05115 [Sphingomonas sp.]|nr:hypothetical protein [Sphingomonas sp.]